MRRFARQFLKFNAAFCGALLVLCLALSAHAQFRFDSWTADNGLPQNSVNSIAQTAEGYIWFTTLDGLVRFDGVRFTVFNKSNSQNFPSNRLSNMIADDENSLWICNEAGVLLRYRDGAFQTFSVADGLPHDHVYKTAKDAGGRVLAFTLRGIAAFDGERFSTLTRYENRNLENISLYFSPLGTGWELNAETLTRRKDGKEFVYQLPGEIKKTTPPDYNYDYYVKMLETPDGVLWFWVSGDNLYKFENEKFVKVRAENTVPDIVTVIARDAEGHIWLGSQEQGACRLENEKFVCFDSSNGLSSDHVRSMLLDREGTLWITTNDKGICRLTKQVVAPFSIAEGLREKNVYSIFEGDAGAIWIGSFKALARYKNGVVTNYGEADGLKRPYVQSLFQDRDGRLWIGSFGGVMYLENNRFYDFTDALEPSGFDTFDIHRDRRGILWFATSIGLIRYDNQKAEILTEQNGLPSKNVKTILEAADGSLWIGTYDGIARLTNEGIISYGEKDGLAGNQIRSLYEDREGTLWIGTYDSGLTRFKNGKFTVYKQANGLFSNGVFQILPDARGNFWMSSNQGIYRVSQEHLNDFADGKRQLIVSTAYGKSDGMLSTECNGGGQPAGIGASDGKLWFPTQDGAAIVDPQAVGFNPLPPPVVIENVRIENQPIANFGNSIELHPDQENLEINYTGLSFIKPEQIRFRYRLEGLDDAWTEAGTRRAAFYPYLPPGNYTFRVVAANSDNVWNDVGAWIKITVHPPFYRTWLFLGICAAAIGLFAFAVYRVRVSRLEKARRAQEEFSRRLINAHESERRRIAAELHDSIGQSLVLIKNRLIFSGMKIADEETKEQLETIAAQTSQTINEVREISYNLRPYLLERLGLTQSIKSFLDEIADLGQLKIEAEIDDVDRLFTPEKEMSLYRIVQESLNNIVKHSEAKTARVSIKKTSRMLTIVIEDDGKGFEPSSSSSDDNGRDKGGFGLIGMAERIRMLGGRHTIESTIGKGTKISIQINLDEEIKKTWREKSE